MRARIGLAILAAGAAVSAASLSIIVPMYGQSQSAATARTADGKPDFTGIWLAWFFYELSKRSIFVAPYLVPHEDSRHSNAEA